MEATVLLPTTGSSPLLQSTLESIAGQTEPPKELIVINDRGDPRVIRDAVLKSGCSSFAVIVDSHYPGIAEALNLGISLATHSRVFRMDDDDIALPERFAEQQQAFMPPAKSVVVGTAVIQIVKGNKVHKYVRYPNTAEAVDRCLMTRTPVAHSSVLFDKSDILAAGGYRPFFPVAQDYDLWLRMRELDVRFKNLDGYYLQRHIEPRQRRLKKAFGQTMYSALAQLSLYWRRRGISDPLFNATSDSSPHWDLLEHTSPCSSLIPALLMTSKAILGPPVDRSNLMNNRHRVNEALRACTENEPLQLPLMRRALKLSFWASIKLGAFDTARAFHLLLRSSQSTGAQASYAPTTFAEV